VIPQRLLYFYLEQEGLSWVLDPNHRTYRNQNPEYCCQSNSRITCRKNSPITVLKRNLEELNFDERRVPIDEHWSSLEFFPCHLLDYAKFIYLIFTLMKEKYVTFTKDDQGVGFLQKSLHEAPRKGRNPNYLRK
jgi:hypothetical protein